MTPGSLRCAVYTRKSTEEGLDQEFNSIDAQREACFAYITSQKFSGWTPIKDSYDDGGFSGGDMERPALQRLLNDVRARKIDVIVVYKIDRLSRTLVDFARLIDLFDKHEVMFISITQSFSTTTSMGRLTMNILLSFAQFEREVTAERIRDKFAASKKKGIWMGGTTPTGYDVKNRLLVPNDQAAFVRTLFEDYLRLGNINDLFKDLGRRGIRSPMRTLTSGKKVGGAVFTRGALYHLLKNPIYIGKIKHKEDLYDGLHEGIIPLDLWQRVQDRIESYSRPVRLEKQIAADPSLLQGKLFDIEGGRYTPHYVPKRNGNGEKHKYYISWNLGKKSAGNYMRGVYRLSAPEIEGHAYKVLQEHLSDPEKLGKVLEVDLKKNTKTLQYIASNSQKLTHVGCAINKAVIDAHQYTLEIQVKKLCHYMGKTLEIRMPEITEDATSKIVVPFRPAKATRGTVHLAPSGTEGDVEALFDRRKEDIRNLVCGVAWREEHFKGKKSLGRIAEQYGVSRGLVEKLIMESFNKMLRPYFSFR